MRNFRSVDSRRGAALIIALAIMVLVLALVVGILSRVSTERSAAGGYASSVGARLLGDTAVQLVQAQIDTATSGGTTTAWTSQPGLIRTFNNAGQPVKSFKLYSDGNMQAAGALNPATEAAALAQWFQTPAVFTDINMPVDTNFDGTPDTWPILDPSAAGVVEGFSITGAPVGKYLGITNAAPMPVRWLYVLQDGQLVAPVASGSAASVVGATDANPIVGRIAFWADDESCKININTASEGTYWDAPKFDTVVEETLANFQPAKNEFQGYPGHPATTSLSPVFPGLSRDQLFSLVPRLQNGGSTGGTVKVSDTEYAALDQDRLYATEDEFLFANSRAANAGVDKAVLERAKFFVTTSSRAPETNLFNLPRIACWPLSLNNNDSYRTPFDRLIAFCSTINGLPYYFQRLNADSATADYQDIARNRVLYEYLKTLNSRAVPGFGGSLAAKYGDDSQQILTEIFDYIRSTNLYDGNLAKDYRFATGAKANTADNKTRLGYGQVTPIRIGTTSGFGRYLSLTEAGLWFICTADAEFPKSNNLTKTWDEITSQSLNPASYYQDKNRTLPGTNSSTTPWDDRFLYRDPVDPFTSTPRPNTKQIRIESTLLLETFTPMMGYAGLRPDIEIKIAGLENLYIRGNADPTGVPPVPPAVTPSPYGMLLGFPPMADQTELAAGRFILGKYSHDVNGGYPTGGNMGIWWTLDGRQIRARNDGRLVKGGNFSASSDGGLGVTKNRQYPFVGEPVTVTVTKTNPQIYFSGGSVVFYVLKRATGEVMQTINADLPSGNFPAPVLYTTVSGTTPYQNKWTFQTGGAGLVDDLGNPVNEGRFDGDFGGGAFFPIVMDHDVVRSVVPSADGTLGADLRLWSLKSTIGTSDPMRFVAHPQYSQTYRQANSFMEYGQGWYVHAFRRPAEYNTHSPGYAGKLANMSQNYVVRSHPDTPLPVPAAQATGDWDNGLTNDADGAYVNKPDEGNTYIHSSTPRVPYFESYGAEMFDVTNFFSPNRIMPSPGMFGSLPTGVARGRHWETLLFRRQTGHPNAAATAGAFTNDPDYLWLDLFWMPVVEPYAISEPLSTAGKINLNQQLVPFTWLDRSTGMYGVLKNEKVISVPNADAATYKADGIGNYRRAVKIPETLKQLQFRFDNSDGTGLYAFRSPAEICDMHIIPDDASPDTTSRALLDTTMATYWASHALTGDNSRERIYTTVYPRLTTRSNTYTVHFRAQSLKKRAGSAPALWDDAKDMVTGDYRGSTTLERFVNPNDATIPDYASDPDAAPSLDSLYRWRLRSHRPFAP
jgi:hypothetical protein